MATQKEAARACAKSGVHPEIGEILRRKRKARGQRACQPCRQRKVKCSYGSPCKTCSDRDHPELCAYGSPSKPINLASTPETLSRPSDGGNHLGPEWDWIWTQITSIEHSLQELKTNLEHFAVGYQYAPASAKMPFLHLAAEDASSNVVDSSTQGIHVNHDFTGETVHLGGNSVAAMVVAVGSGSCEETVRELLGKSILPLFGLDNQSVTYPFVDLWGFPQGSSTRIEELCKLLPSNTDCLQYFGQYRDMAHVLYPGIVDIRQFESDLMRFLANRTRTESNANGESGKGQNVYGMSLHWVGLLFATLASGCQCSALPRKERQLTAQVYVCCAYECLRTINYLAHSTLIDIQNLLILGNVISNNMNAGVAWSLLGLTIRLAQSLGLHRACPPSTVPAEKNLKEEVWWRVVWQDSLLSITYDRASSTRTIKHHQSLCASPSGGQSYAECMKSLCQIGLDIVRERSEVQDYETELAFIVQHHDKLAEIMNQALHHLRDPTACKSMRDQLEHWNLYLHRSYVISELYRPTLKQSSPYLGTTAALKATCIESLANTVDAFLGLENITRFARHSWAAVHRALSSALLLGILREPVKNQRVRMLIDKLVVIMSELSLAVDPSEASAPIARAMSALSRLNYQEVGKARAGRNEDQISATLWTGGDSEASSTSNGQSFAGSPATDNSTDGSPYALMDKILWGSQHTTSL